MTAKIIDGNAVARSIRDECRQRVQRIVAQSGVPPGLAVILVGSDPASRIYVKNKIRACIDVGIRSFRFDYPADVKQDEVVAKIAELNEDPAVHGILVQLPLPASFDMARILRTISADKDVDGFHLYNVGGLVVGGTVFPPCTPYGVLKLLQHENISLEGKNVVVVGASNIVGKPMALMLMQHEATVCICHAKTRDLAQFTLLADVLVVAAGYPNLILPQMVRTGAVVIDVGINRLADGRLVGDVDFAGVAAKASYITPVPGGVGPMTVSMLLINTVTSCERWLRHLSIPVAKEGSPRQPPAANGTGPRIADLRRPPSQSGNNAWPPTSSQSIRVRPRPGPFFLAPTPRSRPSRNRNSRSTFRPMARSSMSPTICGPRPWQPAATRFTRQAPRPAISLPSASPISVRRHYCGTAPAGGPSTAPSSGRTGAPPICARGSNRPAMRPR